MFFYTDHLLVWWHHNSFSTKVKRIQKNEFSYPKKSRNLFKLQICVQEGKMATYKKKKQNRGNSFLFCLSDLPWSLNGS